MFSSVHNFAYFCSLLKAFLLRCSTESGSQSLVIWNHILVFGSYSSQSSLSLAVYIEQDSLTTQKWIPFCYSCIIIRVPKQCPVLYWSTTIRRCFLQRKGDRYPSSRVCQIIVLRVVQSQSFYPLPPKLPRGGKAGPTGCCNLDSPVCIAIWSWFIDCQGL